MIPPPHLTAFKEHRKSLGTGGKGEGAYPPAGGMILSPYLNLNPTRPLKANHIVRGRRFGWNYFQPKQT